MKKCSDASNYAEYISAGCRSTECQGAMQSDENLKIECLNMFCLFDTKNRWLTGSKFMY